MSPQQFRKRPIVITAMQHTAMPEDCRAIAEWSGARWDANECAFFIETLEGVMRADCGDWIIRGSEDEFYPCKARIFAATYEPVGGEVTDHRKLREIVEGYSVKTGLTPRQEGYVVTGCLSLLDELSTKDRKIQAQALAIEALSDTMKGMVLRG